MELAACPVIALVSSAGGLAVTTQVLSDLPGDLPVCVLVLQHSPPGRLHATIDRDQVVVEVVPVHRIADHLVRRLPGAGSGAESVP